MSQFPTDGHRRNADGWQSSLLDEAPLGLSVSRYA